MVGEIEDRRGDVIDKRLREFGKQQGGMEAERQARGRGPAEKKERREERSSLNFRFIKPRQPKRDRSTPSFEVPCRLNCSLDNA